MKKHHDTKNWLSKLKHYLRKEPQNKEELLIFLRQFGIRSILDTSTFAMIESIIAFHDMRARDIMLPKQQMVCLNEHDTLETIIKTVSNSGHSRFPVLGGTTSDVIGIFHAKDLLKYYSKSHAFDIHDIIRPPMVIPESKRLDLLLGEFRNNRNHMAIIVDEYGSLTGFVTIEDIIEQIIGDIEDEFDTDEEAYITTHDNHHFIIKAHMPVEELNDVLNTQFSDEHYDTIGGVITAKFGHLPKRGESLIMNGLEFKVLNADSRRIKLLDCYDRRHDQDMD